MVSLANGNTDVLSNPTSDLPETEIVEIGSSEEQDNAVAEPELNKKVLSFRFLTKKRVTDPGSSEVTNESQIGAESPDFQKSLVETIVSALDKSENASETTDNDLCNGSSDDPSLPLGGCEPLMNGKRSPTDLVDTNSSVSTVSAAGLGGSFVIVGNLKNIGKGGNKRKLYLVNSSSLRKGTSTTEIPANDEGNASVTHNISDVIKKMKVVSSNADVTALKSTPSTRSFVQLSQSNIKNITLNVTPTSKNSVLLKPNQSYEILRNKLLENRVDNPEPTLTEIPTAPVEGKNIFRTATATPQDYVPKFASESSAVTEARNELMRCRRKLIDAAIFPRLTMKVPLFSSPGPFFFCEECNDSFTSEDSLKNHKDRRSVLFTYACPSCEQNLEFYNRCMFLLHIRSHDSAVKACYLNISTIPSNKLKFHTLEEYEESSTSVENHSKLQSSGSSIHVPVIRKPSIESSDTPTESSSVRIVKSMRRKKHPAVDNTNKKLSNDDASSLRSLLIGEREFSQTKSRDENSKLDDELLLAKSSSSKRKKSSESSTNDSESSKSSTAKTENVTKSQSVSKTSVANASEEKETNGSRDDIACGVERKECKTPTVSCGVVDEIILTSSDEEEDSLPEANGRSALVMCRDCKKDVPNLTHHYREDNRPRKEYPCEKCKFFNTSACALSAHNRMHTKTPPFVCPDCGYFFSTLETFLLHVKQVCFYDFKSIRFKCPECSVLKPSVPKFAEHLRRDHTREVFKCDACMTSAYSSAVVEAHITKMHPNPEKPVSVLEGYWCKLCPNMLVSKPLINHHINKHVYSLQYLRYVYICKMCKNYASMRRSKFAHHYQVCPQRKQIEMDLPLPVLKKPNRIRKRSALKKNGKSKNNQVKEGRKESGAGEDCATNNLKKDVKNLCIMCRQTGVSEPSSLFCQQCVQLVEADDASSPSEMTNSEGDTRFKRKFKCKVCKECMNRDWSTITKHFEMYHQSDFDVRAKMRTSSSDSNSQGVAMNRKRKSLVKPQENYKVFKVDPKYRCAKCNIAMNDRKSFHEHIVTHKSQSDFQCLECGLCFIVRLSLEKHLIVEHKIRYGDLKAYFKENGVEMTEEKVEERTLKENQCEVCYLQCGSKQNYDKHIRTHGMAFVAMQSKAKT